MHGKASLLCLVLALGGAAAASNGGQEEGVNNIVDGRQVYQPAWVNKSACDPSGAMYYCLRTADSRVVGQFREDTKDKGETSGDYMRGGVPRYLKCDDEYTSIQRMNSNMYGHGTS